MSFWVTFRPTAMVSLHRHARAKTLLGHLLLSELLIDTSQHRHSQPRLLCFVPLYRA